MRDSNGAFGAAVLDDIASDASRFAIFDYKLIIGIVQEVQCDLIETVAPGVDRAH